ncbi:MAG TPA: hypothetical protein VFW94_00655 [Candidatus Acidoferrales bacterium]|nr:hypothetical protein [Candidatus Acidoferrales bacterium]
MPTLLGLIGVLVVCAGLDLLWQLRREFRFWDLNIFRAMLGFGIPERDLPIEEIPRRRQTALQLLLGMGFAVVIGPALIAIGVTLTFYIHP